MLQAIAKVVEECAPVLSVSQVRAHVLADHHLLRVQMERVVVLAKGGPGRWPQLQHSAIVLLTFARIHFARADEILTPLLRSVGAWGPKRAMSLRENRAERCCEIDRLLRQVSSAHAPPDRLREALLSISTWLKSDLEEAEQTLLHPDLVAAEGRPATVTEPKPIAAIAELAMRPSPIPVLTLVPEWHEPAGQALVAAV